MKSFKMCVWLMIPLTLFAGCYSTKEIITKEQRFEDPKGYNIVENIKPDDMVSVVINDKLYSNLRVKAVDDRILYVTDSQARDPDEIFLLHVEYIQELTLYKFDPTYSLGVGVVLLLTAFWAGSGS